MPNLLLQKPSKISKLKEHQLSLERRLELWKNGESEELLKSIQKTSTIAEISRKFKQLMQKGNINEELNLLTNDIMKSCASEDILINGPLEKAHPV